MDSREEEVITGLQSDELQAGRQSRLDLLVQLGQTFVHQRSVRSRRLEYHKEAAGFTVHERSHRVGFGTDLNRCNILEVQHVTVTLGTNDDILKLFDRLECSFVLHRVLIRVLGLLTERTGRGNETLRTDGRRDIVRVQTILGHDVRFQPYTQRIRVTQVIDLTHTRHTLNAGLDVDVNIVRDEVRVILTIGRFETRDLQDIILTFGYRHTGLQHVCRK